MESAHEFLKHRLPFPNDYSDQTNSSNQTRAFLYSHQPSGQYDFLLSGKSNADIGYCLTAH